MAINKSVTPGVKGLTGNLKSFWAANSSKSCVADFIQPLPTAILVFAAGVWASGTAFAEKFYPT
jgi:hypothetical protein